MSKLVFGILLVVIGVFTINEVTDAQADTKTQVNTTPAASSYSVRLNNYGMTALALPPDHTKKDKLEAAMKLLAKRDNICIGESILYVNGTPGFSRLSPQSIKAINPSAKVYEYWSLMSKPEWDTDWGVDDPSTLKDWRMGVPLTWKQIETNDWWLRDGNGNEVHEPGVPKSHLLDVGKPGFKEAYLQGLLDRMGSKGYDGPMLDYWWPGISWLLVSRQGLPMPKEYPTDQDWYEKAWKPFIEYVTDGLHRAGYKIIGNCVGEYGTTNPKEVWQRSRVDGVNYEQWAFDWYPSSSWLSPELIERRINNMPLDPLEVIVTDSGLRKDDPEYDLKHTVSLAMYYIAIPSSQAKRTYGNTYDKTPHWQSLWDINIGVPAETAVKMPGKYFWSRKYTQGLVLLNYESGQSVSYNLDRAYQSSDGKAYSGSVTLAPHTALIMAVAK